MKLLFTVMTMLFFCAAGSFAAWSLDAETGYVSAGYCDVQIPGDTGTRISLTDDLKVDPKAYYRLRATRPLKNDMYISFLYAPLTLNASGVLAGPVSYNGDSFAAGARVQGTYRFDSYRATWYKVFGAGERFNYKLGFTAKIRDAAIVLSDGAQVSEKKNTGFVPLLHFGINYAVTRRVGVLVDGDAIAGGPGRAEDILLAGTWKAGADTLLRLGYRFVEGGADTQEVYNFALLHYISAAVVITF